MNILIPNSWLKEFLETNATPQEFADAMSLTSVSIEKIEKVDDDYVYDIEVTTNRPDLMSVIGIAREASAVLPQQGFTAKLKPHKIGGLLETTDKSDLLSIVNDKTLVNRILAVILEIDLESSPKVINDRLTKTGIRSINNAVDVTNYIMREQGHPAHVFDYDRLENRTLIIRKSKKGEKIVTLDEKEYVLPGGDIVADDGTGKIVDLLGIMGTANSVVTDTTKRVVLFLDNNNPQILRKTSMSLGIRTEAAVLNEKGVSPEIMIPTLLRGVQLLKSIANAKVISPIIDIYPNKVRSKKISVSYEQIEKLIGIGIPHRDVEAILENLGFGVTVSADKIAVEVGTTRVDDIEIPEDIIEEIARVYGYHKIPNLLPASNSQNYYHQDKDPFFVTHKIKEAFRFWGFNEVYTYSMISEAQYEGPTEKALKLKNPLSEDNLYMRNTLIPSLLQVVSDNKTHTNFKIFEISNVYIPNDKGLPEEVQYLASVIKEEDADFYKAKGYIEGLMQILNIKNFSFEEKSDGIEGAVILVDHHTIGRIEIDEEILFEINFTELLKHASTTKKYREVAKFPPLIEDVRLRIPPHHVFRNIEQAIKEESELVEKVELLDVYEDKKTFRITYRSKAGSLTSLQIAPIREKILENLKNKFKAVPA